MGAAAVGAMTVAGGSVLAEPALASTPHRANSAHPVVDGSDVIAHVINARTGELTILAGDREFKVVDRDLAQRLIRLSH